MRPHFEGMMNYTAGDPVLDDGTVLGTSGPLQVSQQALHWSVLACISDDGLSQVAARFLGLDHAREYWD